MGIVSLITFFIFPFCFYQHSLLNAAPIRPSEPEHTSTVAKRVKTSSIPRCAVFFSEIGAGIEGKTLARPFVELASECIKKPGIQPKNLLAGYKIFFLRFEKQIISLIGIIDFDVVEVNNVDTKKYILLGTPDLPSVDVSLNSPRVQAVRRSSQNADLLPDVGIGLNSFVLVFDDSKNAFKDLQLPISTNAKCQPKPLTANDLSRITEKAVDMIVFSSLEENAFTSIWKQRAVTPGGIQHWNEFKQKSAHKTLSVCDPAYKGFEGSYLVSEQSPGSPNFCTVNAIPSYIPELDHSYAIPVKRDAAFMEYPLGDFTLSSGIYLSEANQLSFSFQFDSSWVQSCANYLPKRSELLSQPSIQSWLFVEVSEDKCKFKCEVCSKYYSTGFRPDEKRKTDIVTTGFYSKDIYSNSDIIKDHEDSVIHIEALEFYSLMSKATNQQMIDSVLYKFELKEKQTFNSTMNMLLLVYSETLSSMSFRKHPQLVKTSLMIGANLGIHYYSETAAQEIALHISSVFQSKLVEHMMKNRLFFSIQADASTNLNEALLIVYVQFLLKGVPVKHFYCLLHLDKGEKGKEMAFALLRKVQEDSTTHPGFKEYFYEFLVAIVTDGASNMVGKDDSFKAHLIKQIQRQIPNVECMNHKLDNGIKRSFKEKPDTLKHLIPAENRILSVQISTAFAYFDNYEKTCNQFYTFYVSWGHKRWLHLLTIAEKLNLVPKKIKYFYEVRWSASHFEALQAIQHDYTALVEDLLTYQTEKGVEKKAKEKAMNLHMKLTDKTYSLTLREFLDFLEVFTVASKTLQESAGSMVGKAEVVHHVLQQLQSLQNSPGRRVSEFLNKCSCDNLCNNGQCTIQLFEECNEVKYENIILKANEPLINYGNIRKILYESLIFNTKRYFNLEVLESFELFNQANIKFITNDESEHPLGSLDVYYNLNPHIHSPVSNSLEQKVITVCKYFFISETDCLAFKNDWTRLMRCVSHHSSLKERQTAFPKLFWPSVRSLCKEESTPVVTTLLDRVFVTPGSSAECERGFSLVNSLRTKSRARMDVKTLEGLVRVKANGPRIENFNSYFYTREWMKSKHIRADDPSFDGGRRVSTTDVPDPLHEGSIY